MPNPHDSPNSDAEAEVPMEDAPANRAADPTADPTVLPQSALTAAGVIGALFAIALFISFSSFSAFLLSVLTVGLVLTALRSLLSGAIAIIKKAQPFPLVQQLIAVFSGLAALLLVTQGNPAQWMVAVWVVLSIAGVAYAEYRNTDIKEARKRQHQLELQLELVRQRLAQERQDQEELKKQLKLDRVQNILTRGRAGRSWAGVDLSGTNLAKANFIRADLTGANLSRAILSGADFSRANLSEANLRSADLTRANLQGAVLKGTNFEQAIVDRALFSDQAALPEQIKAELKQRGAVFIEAPGSTANLPIKRRS